MAGSRGFVGAGLLAATGALRGGAGLVTLFVKEDVYPVIAAKATLELMVRVTGDYRDVLSEKFDALAIGPGLGFEAQDEVLEVIRHADMPAVIDADALTMLARDDLSLLLQSSAPRLLTPHPGEMARFFAAHPQWQKLDRRALAEAFATTYHGCTLLLKGARTVIAQSGMTTCFNTTGTPAMATGGMGDVLTGLCAGLIAQGVSCFDAACLGAWLGGRSAEIAITDDGQSIESLAAGDVLRHLGAAFGDLKAGVY
jgi:NAD(P)H-hydrate epimerase